MQNPDSTRSRCPKCGAGRGYPCVTNAGFIAARVHYGRPYWSSKVAVPKAERAFFSEIIAEVEARRYPN